MASDRGPGPHSVRLISQNPPITLTCSVAVSRGSDPDPGGADLLTVPMPPWVQLHPGTRTSAWLQREADPGHEEGPDADLALLPCSDSNQESSG